MSKPLTEPVTVTGVFLDISNDNGLPVFGFDVENMSKLLTSPHLVCWEQYQ